MLYFCSVQNKAKWNPIELEHCNCLVLAEAFLRACQCSPSRSIVTLPEKWHLSNDGTDRLGAKAHDAVQKEVTRRTATARMHIHLSQEVFREVMNPKHLKKGNVIETARIAGGPTVALGARTQC